MPKPKRLSAAERRFLDRIAQAAFSNPFSPDREVIDRDILGETGPLSREERMDRLEQAIGRGVHELESRGIRGLDDLEAADHAIARPVFLFDVYNRFRNDFDDHIAEQMRSGDEPLAVPFARRALDRLEGLGFDAEAGERHLALLFQVRRAYYFIDRALVGTSPSMGELRRQLWNCVFTHDIRWYDRYLLERMEDFSTLILGETGTGKGTAAAAIGRSGFIPFDAARRRFVESFTRSFVAINLSQFPELLIESELFGHRKGAFTGAVDDHRGLLSLCSHRGSVFLDEIGEVGAPVQIKLLQVLQERIFTPVGDHRPQPFRGRVIAATNRPIEELLEGGGFRRDFYYRLCSQTVDVPSLRRRLDEDPGELDALLAHTLERLTGEREPSLLEFVARTIRETLPPDYPWAGNVRELEQCARSILLTRSYRPLAAAAGRSAGERLLEDLESGRLDARELVSRYCARLHERLGTVAEVARRVGLDRRTVKRHIEEGKRGQEPFSGRKGS